MSQATGVGGAPGGSGAHRAGDTPDPQRWLLLAGVWAMYTAFGLVVASLAPVLTPVGEDLGLSKSRLGVILGTWPAVFVFAALPAGRLLDRIGLRWALFIGGVLLCLSGVLRGLATGGVSLFLAVAVFGLGGPMISNGAPKLVVSRFPERERAKATSLYLTAPVAGQIIAVAVANSVIRPLAGGSWRSVPLVLAAVTGIICVLWLMLTARLESRASNEAPGRGLGLDSATRRGAADLLANPVMRLILMMAVAIFFVNHGLNNWLPKIIEDFGASPEAAGYFTAVSYAAGLIGPLVFTRLGARRPLAAPVVVSLCLAVTVAMLAVVSGVAATPFLLLVGFLRFGLIALCVLTLMGAPRRGRAQHGCGQRPVLHRRGDRRLRRAVRRGRHRRRHRRLRGQPVHACRGDGAGGMAVPADPPPHRPGRRAPGNRVTGLRLHHRCRARRQRWTPLIRWRPTATSSACRWVAAVRRRSTWWATHSEPCLAPRPPTSTRSWSAGPGWGWPGISPVRQRGCSYHEFLAEPLGRLVGGGPHEVVAMNSLTVNLHLLMVSFYVPTASRHKILIEERAFPSDHFAVESQIRQRGLDPAESLVLARPRAGEHTLQREDLLGLIAETGAELALVLLPGVHYYTGQVLPLADITASAHEVGARVGFDVAHAAGNVPLALHDWDVDFAAWCNYKYLNGSPGAVGGAFVHERHLRGPVAAQAGRLVGPPRRYSLRDEHPLRPHPHRGVVATLEPAHPGHGRSAGFPRDLRSGGRHPAAAGQVGAAVCLPGLPAQGDHRRPGREHHARGAARAGLPELAAGSSSPEPTATPPSRPLIDAGIVCDWRHPDVIRLAPVPLYNTFDDIRRFVATLDHLLDQGG